MLKFFLLLKSFLKTKLHFVLKREVQGGENTNDGQSGNENNDANTSTV